MNVHSDCAITAWCAVASLFARRIYFSSNTHYACLQECLSVTQKTLLLSYKETVDALRRDELQKRISSAIEEAEEEEVCGCPFCAVCGVLCMCTCVQSECWQLHMWVGVSGYSPRPAPLAGLTVPCTLLAPPQLPPKREVVPLLRMKVTGTSSDMDKIPTGTSAG